MKRTLAIFVLFIALFADSISVNADAVSQTAAQTIAINFFKVTSKNITGRDAITATLVYTKTEPDNTADYYVFNISPVKGFVMVSADDRVSPVIAYSTESAFTAPAKGSGVQSWMNNAGARIYSAVQRKVVANQVTESQWSAYLQGQKPASAKAMETGVAPLLTTKWDQEPYYNQLCPYNAADSMRTVTGCVATAMAQIMKYWNYPAQGTGQYGYLDAPPMYFYNYGNQSANFGATTYNWQNMPDSLSANNTAVATLMYHCGVAVAMNYGDDNQGGSGAYVLAADVAGWRHTAQMAYTTYFSYNANTLRGVRQSDYSAADWVNLIESELMAGRPVQYAGTDTNAGSHTWVCDGYDANDLLHMNWGWGGLDNGYYSVNALTADGYNFSTSEEALIGIEPKNNLNVTATVAEAAICYGSNTTLTAQGNSATANYIWTPATGLSCAQCAATTASPDTTTTYTVTMDSAGLSAITQVTVTVNSKMNVVNTVTTDATCFGSANGSAKINISGGTAGYNYQWNNGEAGMLASGLAAGNYAVTVSDAKGCTISASATVAQPDSMVASITPDNAACSLDSANLTVGVQGGTPTYSFVWGGGQNTSSVSSPVAGDYTVSVTDAAGCSASASASVAQPASINVSIVASNTACSLLYATATANVTGGSQNLSFIWSTGESTPSITNLSAGNFSVTVTDGSGCSSTASQNLIQPDSMNISIASSNIPDNKVYGRVVANVTGGTPQYSYLWNTGDSTPEISIGTAGTYTVTITDTKGCIKTAATEISETTGMAHVTDNRGFDVYPNPATTSVTVRVADINNEETTLELKNLLGQSLMFQKVTVAQSHIDLSGMAAGTYLIVLKQGSNTGTKEIIIQK